MITQTEMQRQIIRYAMEETRNRALEEAAEIVEALDAKRQPLWRAAELIRNAKRDPAAQLTDWWAPDIKPLDFIPIGA